MYGRDRCNVNVDRSLSSRQPWKAKNLRPYFVSFVDNALLVIERTTYRIPVSVPP